MTVGILDVDYHVPPTEVSNDTISAWADTTPEWIVDRTGIRTRRYAHTTDPTSTLAVAAARRLLDRHQADPSAIIVATSTPDHPLPATAAIVQGILGFRDIPAFDVNAVCTGFLYALRLASALVHDDPRRRPVLVIAADKYSTIMDRSDRRTVALFGDGAAAALVGPVPDGSGLLAQQLVTHGALHDTVKVPAGGSRQPIDARALEQGDQYFKMNGRGARDYALNTLPALVDDVLREADLGVGDIDRFVFHQANLRLVEELAIKIGADPDRVPVTVDRFGNTGAASVPVTLAHSHRERPIAHGENILLAGVGGGLTGGAAVLRWHRTGGSDG
ncbi:3-oxoacyl-ACP synthase III family protein [Nocardia sp. NPDC004750]